jgi:general control protein GCN4
VTPPATVNITSNNQLYYNSLPSYPFPSDFPSQETLTSSTAPRFRSSPSTANIPLQEFPLFTTDSPPPWLPSSSSSLPAHSPQQPLQRLSVPDHQVQTQQPQSQPHQDFVLFETPAARSSPSLSSPHAQQHGAHRRHSSHLASAQSLQNQRVAAIIQATGHSISTSSLTNRFHPAQQQQFYASSAPSSTTALQQQQQQQRPTRPQVPLFSQSTGNIPHTPNMAMQGTSPASSYARGRDSHRPADMDLFDDGFTPFEGGASMQNAFPSAYSSPAVPTNYDFNANLSTSSSTTNMGTVSPQDLLVRDPFASAPNSTAFTNLTSPSTYNESPEYNDNFDVSPFVGNHGDLDQALAGDPWYPLFPQDDQLEQAPKVDQSPLLAEEELEVSEHLRSNRRRSGTGTSPTGNHASISGVNARKRDKPLPPIIVDDPNDTVAMKRARNTLAARKSRQRKMQRFDELEDKIAKLEAERDHWKDIALRRTGGQ